MTDVQDCQTSPFAVPLRQNFTLQITLTLVNNTLEPKCWGGDVFLEGNNVGEFVVSVDPGGASNPTTATLNLEIAAPIDNPNLPSTDGTRLQIGVVPFKDETSFSCTETVAVTDTSTVLNADLATSQTESQESTAGSRRNGQLPGTL